MAFAPANDPAKLLDGDDFSRAAFSHDWVRELVSAVANLRAEW
jgi:hypothetical protein